MFSFLGDFFSLMLGWLFAGPRRLVKEIEQLIDDCVEFFRVWLMESLDTPQQTMASARWSVGPPGGWLTFVRNVLWPNRLARVRVPTRRSIR